MTQSYFEYLGRQEAAPFTNEKLDYEPTEPDLTKQVNDQIDKNIQDRKEFFQANIDNYNATMQARSQRVNDIIRLTTKGRALLSQRQEYLEDKKAFDELSEIYNDPEKRGTYATVEKNIEQVEGELKNDEDVEIATIESSGKDTSGQVVSGTQLLDFKKTITAEEFLNGRHASKSMQTYWPIYLQIAKGSLTYNNKLYEDLTFSEQQEWMKVAGANFVAMFAKANPKMTESQVITNFMPSFDSTSKAWAGQAFDVQNNAVNQLRSNTSTQNYINAIKVSAEAYNNPNVKSATISSVYDKSGFIQNKIEILKATGDPNPAQTANKMWTDMIVQGIGQDQFTEQDIEYLLYQDKFVAAQHKGTNKLSSYYDIQPKNANRIAQAFIDRNTENNRDSELKRIQDLEKRLLDGQEVPQDILTTFTNEDLRTKAEQLLAAGEVREFDRPEFAVEQELFKKFSADRANLINPKKFSNDPQWRDQTSDNIYKQAGDFFKKKYQERFDISGDRPDALEKAREATLAALNNGQFDNVISEVIEDSKLLKTAKLVDLYNADIKAALNSRELLAGEEDPVLNAVDYFNGKTDKLDHVWTRLARLYKNKGPLKLAHDRLVVLNKIKPIPSLMYNADVKVLDSPLLNHKNNATKTIQAAENGITNSENYNEMLSALSKNQEQNGGVNAIKDPDGNYVTELPLGKPLSEHTIQEVYGLVQDGYTNIGLYDMTPTALTQVFNSNIGVIDFTKPFDEVAQSKLLMSRLYHKANNQHLFGNADTSYRRLMNFTEDQIEQYEKLIDEIPPFMRLNTLYGPAAKEAIDLNL